ncbi:MAG: AarF/UbiB family protein [Candidatus Nanopelagicales bacterium]
MDNGDVQVTFDFDFVSVALFLFVIGWITGRLLGVKRGFWRAFFAGLVGLMAGYALVYFQFGEIEDYNDLGEWARLGVGFLGYVLLVTMLTSIVIEAILRPRQGRSRRIRIPHPFRWIRQKLALVQRLWQIAMAARRNGLVGRKYASRAALATPEGAHALRMTLEQCGGMFVKFGQIAAGRDDLLPAPVTAELGELRTAVTPLPPEVVHQVLRQELGDAYDSTFAWFDDQPLAAASVGVTHRARLADGRDVIVKIQRPRIDEIVERDGRVLLWSARQLERGSDSARSLGIVDLCQELLASVTDELDFTREAKNNAAMRRHAGQTPGVEFPEVIEVLTTRRMLVMDLVTAEPVSDSPAVDAAPMPRRELADRLLSSFLDQVLHDGVYHADPHPGNILIDSDGVLWFIDFGAVGHIDPITIEALQQMAIGFSLRDPGMLARAVRRLAGGNAEDLDIPSLEFDMGQVLTQVEGGGFGPAAIAEVVHVLRRHQVRVPRALTVLGRSAVTMEGTLREVSSGYSMSEEAQRLVRAEPTPGTPQDLAQQELLRALPSLRPLPQLTEDIALQLRSGRLGLQIERFGGEDSQRVDQWLDRILWAGMGMTGLIGSAMLLIAGALIPPEDGAGMYLRVIGFVGLVVSSAMQMRTIARVLQRRDPQDVG